MRPFLFCAVGLVVFIIDLLPFSNAEAEYGFGYPVQDPFYLKNNEQPASSLIEAEQYPINARGFFATVTLTLATSTSYYIYTTTTTCTTSTTTAVRLCSPSKGRRRRQNFGIHRLMFEEDEFDDSNIFAPRKPEEIAQETQFAAQQQLIQNSISTFAEESAAVPFVVQPGFSLPADLMSTGGRFLIAFGTTTIQVFTSTTLTYSLTATCRSTTAFQTCGVALYSGREGLEADLNQETNTNT